MNDDLLLNYQKELTFIRKLGGEFADDHQDVAAALRLGKNSCDDPHVERMIMAFALIAARIRTRLDDDFPEVSQGLLGVLYPHYLAPIPSMAVVELKLDRGQAALAQGYAVPGGQLLESEPVPGKGESCRFRTVAPLTLWPLEVAAAGLSAVQPAREGPLRESRGLLRIELRCFAPAMTVGKLATRKLRFFLHGQKPDALALHELVLHRAVEVSLAAPGEAGPGVFLGKGRLEAVGFGPEEGMLPYPPQSFPGYRLLTEYFVFPEKFRFFEVDLGGLEPARRAALGNRVELRIHLDRSEPLLEPQVTADSFRLGCTPVVNLFECQAESIPLDGTAAEHRVIPDRRRVAATEVYSIDEVSAADSRGGEARYDPLFSLRHGGRQDGARQKGTGGEGAGGFWHSTRRPSTRALDDVDRGTEVHLSLLDPDLRPLDGGRAMLDVRTTCLNRDLPALLPFGAGRPVLRLLEGGPISEVSCLTPPTPTRRLPLGGGLLWRLVSHLTLNHLSLCGSPDALREMLGLYDFARSPETRAKLEAIVAVRARRSVAWMDGPGGGGYCRGVEVEVEIDEARFADRGLFLFASVLERLLGLYTTINSFTRLVVTVKGGKEVFKRWPPRSGERTTL